MTTLEEEREQARALARQIHDDARNNPDSPYAGKFVGILRGQAVVVADTLDEVAEALEQLEPDRVHHFFTEASANYDEPVYIYAGRSVQCRGLHGR